MCLVDWWDVEDVRFRILSGSILVDRLFPTGDKMIDDLNWDYWKHHPDDLPNYMPDYCWEWQGPNSGKGNGPGRGYGRMSYRNKTHAVHRLSYNVWNGPLIGKKQVDHMCNNRLCCNPKHLQLVTNKVNSRLRTKRQKIKEAA